MRLRLIAVAVLLSACQFALPGKAPEPEATSPITGDVISVTALEDTVGAVAPGATDAAVPAPMPAEGPPSEPEIGAAEPVVAPTSPPPQKSATQVACERRGGAWVVVGTTGTMSCQTPQPDAGKACRRDSDCEGQCLARSQSCAPFAPLFGCNEVLQDNGQRVTLCIE